jgi:hypothetical protein
MVSLGSYAREFEVVAKMTCARFDIAPVLRVEKDIRGWSDPEYSGPSDQDDFELSSADGNQIRDDAQYKEDLRHCAEAWRYGLLTYICRVFKWERNQPPPPRLEFLARKTLNHVSSCRSISMLQKQLLLPVFLAGCETTDDQLRQVARNYCSRWNDQTRYDMFLTANAVLEEVWTNDDPKVWWGSVMDQRTPNAGGSAESKQYLFG